MPTAVVTGSLGLVGSYVAVKLKRAGFDVYGVDADIRSQLFPDVSRLTKGDTSKIYEDENIETKSIDVRDYLAFSSLIKTLADDKGLDLVIHCAAQPSHDWAAGNPFEDASLNINATLNVCESLRQHSPSSLLCHLSTNKVYGDTPNKLPLIELESRYEIDNSHGFYNGIDESMTIDGSMHSLFGVSKTAGDLYVQEYSRYFGIPAIILRGGCLTGAKHRGAQLHGFLNYLIRCGIEGKKYTILGYKGKQVRDNLHAEDIADLIIKIFSTHADQANRPAYPIVANLGGGRENSVSVLEIIDILSSSFDIKLDYDYKDESRTGDHIWYISDTSLLGKIFNWKPNINIHGIVSEIIEKIP